ncbi:hypothetical protein [Lumpy skin disease virus]|uniref:Uncharacterized protein n=1 Tax=Lumpy skin disease virus TaxID=59509 RepID=Q910J8_LSDV|nr:hypothetical protein LSDVgp001 [Lumpy skin disease virus NI-2490]NP_150590.1 hypothetical protein LSDVgp156 [Lumpy skin disease virus NI-2490]AAN02567.1 hypothetical protein [Lumpy skin disease virus NW-LW]AGY30916.1 hypothetical protein [Lumpy skin disease virus]AAK84962.1 LSDV001 hypothetical protein [Lumpy skin disease virus NI-2490]AAK85117.1 LSDV156 hypothetical protein [Lumpy skin disease virus NI-2490]AAN02724.1 hypothetical protein [Lumpy skin disease virus NW-LW]
MSSGNYVYRNNFSDDDDITTAISDYLFWSSLAFSSREVAGKVFLVFESFKKDASLVFGNDLTAFVKNMFLDSKIGFEQSKIMINSMLKKENYIRESCAVIGILARAAEYWGGESSPTCSSVKVLVLLRDLVSDNDISLVKSALIIRLKRLNEKSIHLQV